VLTDEKLGGVAARLALEFPSWVERRVEHVSYLDRSTIRWTEGVMFRWPQPEFFGGVLATGDMVYVPLDLLTKGPLTALDGKRPDGSPFPILPYGRSTALASAGMIALIWGLSQHLGQQGLQDGSLKSLDAIIRAPPELAARLLQAVLEEDTSGELAQVLATSSQFRGLLEELATNVMLLAPAVYGPEEEVVYRYTYCQELRRNDPLPQRIAAVLGYQDVAINHERLSYGWSHSYHFEVDAPREVRIARARLRASYGSDRRTRVKALIAEAGGSPVIDLHARRPTAEAFANGQASDPLTRPPVLPVFPRTITTAGILQAATAAKPTDTESSDQGEAEVRLRLDPSGTFLAATVVSSLTALLLVAATTRLAKLDGQTSATLLLALPVLALGYLTRSGEHSLATRLLTGIRAMAVLVGVCALIVAGILAGGFVHTEVGKKPGYACDAHVTDLALQPLRHHSWKTRADPDIAQLHCRSETGTPRSTTLSSAAQHIADAVTSLAGLLALLLASGWLSTRLRSSGMLPEGASDPASRRA
jgi:hypothetical protein